MEVLGSLSSGHFLALIVGFRFGSGEPSGESKKAFWGFLGAMKKFKGAAERPVVCRCRCPAEVSTTVVSILVCRQVLIRGPYMCQPQCLEE